jgi:hypothetical protein
MKSLLQKDKANMLKSWASFRMVLTDDKGEGMLDVAIGIMISVVLGALVLAGLYTLFDSTILPELSNKISQMFNYAG